MSAPSWPWRVAHALGCVPDQLGFLQRAVRWHGDLVDLSAVRSRPRFLLNHPDDIGHVLQHNHPNYHKTPKLTGPAGRARVGHGLLSGTGAPALTQKRLLQPVLNQCLTAALARMMVDCTRQMLADWPERGTVDVGAEMLRLTRRIMGRALVGLDLETDAPAVAQAITTRQEQIHRVYESPLAARCHQAGARRALAVIDRFLLDQIGQRRRKPDPPTDLLGMFVAARYADGSAMTDQQVRDEALTIISTGYETLALGLTWTLYLLARHPAAQRCLIDETRARLADRAATFEDAHQLGEADRVFAEGLRLYPPTWLFVRVAQGADVLPRGAHLAAGTTLFLSPYITQRDPRYFPEPDRFDPQRFAADRQAARPRFAYFPFAAGPRICLGQHFARLEAVLVLATLAQQVSWQMDAAAIPPRPGQSLFPSRPVCLHYHHENPVG